MCFFGSPEFAKPRAGAGLGRVRYTGKMASSKKSRSKRSRPGDFIQFLAYSVIAGLLVALVVLPPSMSVALTANASMSWFQDLPDDISDENLSKPSTVYASDGTTKIATFFAETNTQVKLEQMSPYLKDAIISVEDREFYNHGAVSPIGIGRAFFNNILNPNKRQGASTLTQQYVNNLIINADVARGEDPNTLGAKKTYVDKIKEMKLAISMERNKTKDQILEGYLNIVNMGGQNIGVEAASQFYWGKSAKDLTIAQAALLAGLVQAPNIYDPTKNPDLARERRDIVLSTMLRDKKITQQEFEEAVASDIKLDVHPTSQGCSIAGDNAQFCYYMLYNFLGDSSFGPTLERREATLRRGGLKIVTTLNPEAQVAAKKAVEATQPGATNWNDINAALTSVEPGTGRVVAMAQNSQWGNPVDANDHSVNQFNYNVDSAYGGTGGFQPGSTFKPVVLAQWIASGKGVNAIVNGTSLLYPASFGWNAKCLEGGKFYFRDDPAGFSFKNAVAGGQTWNTAAYGIRQSWNSYLYGMVARLDLCDIRDMAERLHVHDGFGNPLYKVENLSSNIGGTANGATPLTMASTFAVFASEGKYCEPRPLDKVIASDGSTMKEYTNDCQQVLDADVANGVSWVLKGVIAYGGSAPDRGIGLPNASAAKTGTNDNSSQTWMTGYTRGLSTSSWVGSLNQGSRSMNNLAINGRVLTYVDGATYAGAQWQSFMRTMAPKYNKDDFTNPSAQVLSAAG